MSQDLATHTHPYPTIHTQSLTTYYDFPSSQTLDMPDMVFPTPYKSKKPHTKPVCLLSGSHVYYKTMCLADSVVVVSDHYIIIILIPLPTNIPLLDEQGEYCCMMSYNSLPHVN